MSRRIAWIVALLLLLPVVASGSEEVEHEGIYFGANLIYGAGIDGGAHGVAPHTAGLGIVATQRFTYFAAEIYGNWLYGAFDGSKEGMQLSFGLRGKGYFPAGPVDPYLVLGIGPLVQETDKWRWGGEWQAGGGIEYFFNEKWAIAGEVVYRGGTGHFKDLQYVNTSIGVRKLF